MDNGSNLTRRRFLQLLAASGGLLATKCVPGPETSLPIDKIPGKERFEGTVDGQVNDFYVLKDYVGRIGIVSDGKDFEGVNLGDLVCGGDVYLQDTKGSVHELTELRLLSEGDETLHGGWGRIVNIKPIRDENSVLHYCVDVILDTSYDSGFNYLGTGVHTVIFSEDDIMQRIGCIPDAPVMTREDALPKIIDYLSKRLEGHFVILNGLEGQLLQGSSESYFSPHSILVGDIYNPDDVAANLENLRTLKDHLASATGQ